MKLSEVGIWEDKRQSDIETLLILQTKEWINPELWCIISVVDKEPVEILNCSGFIQSPAPHPHFYFDKGKTWL